MVPLKYLRNFWRTLEMPLINREINVISDAATNQATTFAITDTKCFALVVILSSDDNAKLLQQLESGFKRKINWNKYQSKRTT